MKEEKEKEKKCVHKWHFMEKEYVGGGVRFKYFHLGGFLPIELKEPTNTYAVFVCGKCGATKNVELKENEKTKNLLER